MVTWPVTIIPAAVGPPGTGVPHGPAPALTPAVVVTTLPEPLPPDPLMALPEDPDPLMPLPEDALMPLPEGPLMPLPEFVPDPPPEGEVPLVPLPEDALTVAPEAAPAPELLLPLTTAPGPPVSPPHPDANAASSTGNANR